MGKRRQRSTDGAAATAAASTEAAAREAAAALYALLSDETNVGLRRACGPRDAGVFYATFDTPEDARAWARAPTLEHVVYHDAVRARACGYRRDAARDDDDTTALAPLHLVVDCADGALGRGGVRVAQMAPERVEARRVPRFEERSVQCDAMACVRLPVDAVHACANDAVQRALPPPTDDNDGGRVLLYYELADNGDGGGGGAGPGAPEPTLVTRHEFEREYELAPGENTHRLARMLAQYDAAAGERVVWVHCPRTGASEYLRLQPAAAAAASAAATTGT